MQAHIFGLATLSAEALQLASLCCASGAVLGIGGVLVGLEGGGQYSSPIVIGLKLRTAPCTGMGFVHPSILHSLLDYCAVY